MNVEQIREYCLSKSSVTEGFPFDESTLVFKVAGKMFALYPLERTPPQINLKCDPERAIELRETYDGLVTGAFHMNKTHWNSVWVTQLPASLVKQLIDHSYELVVSKLPKNVKNTLI